MTTYDEHDPEDLDRQGDPTLGLIMDDLAGLYGGAVQPPHLRDAVDRAIYARLGSPRRLNARAHRVHAHLHAALPQADPRRSLDRPQPKARARRRRVVLVGVLLAAVLGVGGVYAAGSLVDGILPPAVLGHTQSLDMSQGACGFTMTVTRAYLDSNQAIVGFTITGPAGRSFVPGLALPFLTPEASPSLLTAQGASLLLLQTISGDVAGTTRAQTMQFDAGSLASTPGTNTLRLEVPYIAMTEQLTGGAWTTSPCETYRQDATPPRFRPGTKPTRVVAIKGPFIFDLRLAASVGPREADPRQVAQSGGERVALDRVVVTPADTRVYVWREAGSNTRDLPPRLTVALGTGVTPTTDDSLSHAIAATYTGTFIPAPSQDTAAVPGTPPPDAMPGTPPPDAMPGTPPPARDIVQNPEGIVEYNFIRAPSLYGYHGPWTLTVPTRNGAVTFHFTVGDTPSAPDTPSMGASPTPSGTVMTPSDTTGAPASTSTVGTKGDD
jgi:hypothetical protein